MSEFEQQRRQLLLDEDFYLYIHKNLVWQVDVLKNELKKIDDPFVEPMIDLYYKLACLDYTAGLPIINLLSNLDVVMEYTRNAVSFVERNNLENPDDMMDISILTEYFESEILSNLLGLSILFQRKDWLQTFAKAVDLDSYNREKALDSLIAMQISGYPITDAKTPRELSFRNPLYKAIHAETEKETVKHLDEYLRLWYDGLRKAGNVYIDSHLLQQGDSRDCCSFVGYWCFEAAAVSYLKNIDDSSLHRFMYYPKDMVAYARAQA